MIDWFTQFANAFQGSPFLQGLIAAVSTFVLEDPATVSSGLLVADGRMSYWAAFIGLATGIAVGDIGLYLLGRFARFRVVKWRWIHPRRLRTGSKWFDRNLIVTILSSRFIPGLRLPTYVAAGMMRVSMPRFVLVAIAASLVWTFCLLSLTIELGEQVLDQANRWRWLIGVAIVLTVILVQLIVRWRIKRSVLRSNGKGAPLASSFEFWSPYKFYLPVVLHAIWLAIRFRGAMLPTVANPRVRGGGFVMESKHDLLKMIGHEHREKVAKWTRFTAARDNGRPDLATAAQDKLDEANLDFPLVVKPDIGQRGSGVILAADMDRLTQYLKSLPGTTPMLFQEKAPGDCEAGIFYIRQPDETKGRIFSLTLKEFPKVTGDGQRSLRRLILEHPRASMNSQVYLRRHGRRLSEVPGKGERIRLVFAGNHAQGAVFRNGEEHITDELTNAIDRIAQSMPEFYFGRFDMRFQSLEKLRQGKGFVIVEVNAGSSEATHIWDPETKLIDAYRTLFRQNYLLYQIGFKNRKRGYRTMAPRDFVRDVIEYKRRARSYPPSD